MFIQVIETPNPKALKFVLDTNILKKGEVYHLKSKAEAQQFLIAEQLFALDEVTDVFLGTNFISISIKEAKQWELLKPKILSFITDFTAIDELMSSSSTSKKKIVGKDSIEQEVIDKITEMFEERIRPAVAMDGGDIVFINYQAGKVYISMHGACAGCPSADMTLKNGIENMLKYYIPEVTEVIDIEQKN